MTWGDGRNLFGYKYATNMNRLEWMLPTTDSEANRRAGGRRRYNAQRQMIALNRRLEMVELIQADLNNAEIARRFGVHRSTIGRDIKKDFFLLLLDNRKLKRLLNKIQTKAAKKARKRKR